MIRLKLDIYIIFLLVYSFFTSAQSMQRVRGMVTLSKKAKAGIQVDVFKKVMNAEAPQYILIEEISTESNNEGYFELGLLDSLVYVIQASTNGYRVMIDNFRTGDLRSTELNRLPMELKPTANILVNIKLVSDRNRPVKTKTKVTMVDDKGISTIMYISKSKKYYLKNNTSYRIEAEANGYLKTPASTYLISGKDKASVSIPMHKIILNKYTTLPSYPFKINSIAFSEHGLDMFEDLIDILKRDRYLELVVQVHTDSRGQAGYNQKLSQRRADTITEYLLKKGVRANQIFAKGYGEKHILNHCTDGVLCTTEDHHENRRVEIEFIEIY